MKRIPQVKKLGPDEKAALSDRLERNALTPEDCEIILNMFDTLEFIFEKANQKDVQLKALPKRILGIKSEKSKKIRDNLNSKNPSESTEGDPTETMVNDHTDDAEIPSNPPNNERPKGHGRIGADAYTGADRVFIPLSTFEPGDKCQECPGGKVYPQNKPGVFIHIEGRAPIGATVYELEKYRRNLCGEVFSAELPDNVAMKSGKYTEHGAYVGDMFMSLIYTCNLAGENPFDYLTQLQVNSSRVFKNPDKWLPWNWRETLSVGPVFSPNQCGAPIL